MSVDNAGHGFLADKALTLLMLVILAVVTASARVMWVHSEEIAELSGMVSGDQRVIRRLDTTLESVRDTHESETIALDNMGSIVDSYRAHVVIDSTQTARHDERIKVLELMVRDTNKEILALGIILNARTKDRYYASDAVRDHKILDTKVLVVAGDIAELHDDIVRLDDVDRQVLVRLGIMENGNMAALRGQMEASMGDGPRGLAIAR